MSECVFNFIIAIVSYYTINVKIVFRYFRHDRRKPFLKGPLTLLIADYCKYKSGIYYTFEVKKKLYIIEDQIYQERKQIIFRRK